jgi:TetR/AcrR family transcriptional regulator, regulator of cefoperazone and chloramphenicol sensitivity
MRGSRRHRRAARPEGINARDQSTRQRLLDAAAHLFAERAFREVTIRQICRAAGANVAAVNYHFGDKLGLYREVLRVASGVMRAAAEAAMSAGGRTPEARLSAHVREYVHQVLGQGRDSWIHPLLIREMADPTPALDLVVERAMRPWHRHLCGLVGELLDCPAKDERVLRSVASIQAQCVHYLPNPITSRLRPGFRLTPGEIDRLARHIAAFSLAGIRAVAGPLPRLRRRRSGWRARRDRVSAG